MIKMDLPDLANRENNEARKQQLARSKPYVPGRFVPGAFSVGKRDTYHFDIYAERRPGYVQWYYKNNPETYAVPMEEYENERAFAIRGKPGNIYIRDERWDIAADRSKIINGFPTVESAMAWVKATLLIE